MTSMASLRQNITARSVLTSRRLFPDDNNQTVHSVRVRNMAGNDADMEVIAHCHDRRHSKSKNTSGLDIQIAEYDDATEV